jgi:hypothetical protein
MRGSGGLVAGWLSLTDAAGLGAITENPASPGAADGRRAMRRWNRLVPAERDYDANGRWAMGLEMKPACERCAAALAQDGEAWICSYECTWCRRCAESMAFRCPNCSGELLRRPPRAVTPAAR